MTEPDLANTLPTRNLDLSKAAEMCANLHCKQRRARGLECPACVRIANAFAEVRKYETDAYERMESRMRTELRASRDEYYEFRDSLLELLGVVEE